MSDQTADKGPSSTGEVTHDCPREGESVTLCCGRIPFELPRSDRMTLDQALVTCTDRKGSDHA